MINPEMKIVDEDVVISGIGGYFPQSTNFEEFGKHLLDNDNLIEDRWKEGMKGIVNKFGVIQKEYFDNAYFGIHRQQCTYMDPMQRLILERTFEALIDAGVNPVEVRGKRIGVFMGSCIGESDNLFMESVVSGFGIVGHSRAMMSNRVSYWLNLNGPSVAYNSSWIGGMEMLRMAYESIKTGQCEAAIVGTGNVSLNSEIQWIYNDMGFLSPDGVTRAFDVEANGYARADGVVVFFLQKASAARRSYASIEHIGTRFDGNGEGNILNTTVPNLVEFLNEFYETSPVKPEEIQFLETYGSGLKDLDEKELNALDQVYGKNSKEPLLIGSVKTNAGHSEASSVMFSIAKVLVAMEHDKIPANLHFKTPNPNAKGLVEGRMEVVTENREWKPKYAAVNALGVTSFYGHVILKANQKEKSKVTDNFPRLAIASTRTEEGIKDILEKVKTYENDDEYFQLMQELFAKPILGHLYRGYTLVGASEPKEEFVYHQGTKRPVWFVYSGMGSQWNSMVSDFMKIPIFASAINNCHNVLLPKGVNLLEVISSDDKTIFDNILNSFVGIAAMQIALTDLLRAIGIEPDGLIGHSVGELGCAYADGCLTAEQMILSAYSRGRASLDAELIPGMMAAIGVGYNAIKDKLPPSIEVACHNGPDSATLSGPREDMEKYVATLQEQGTFARLVNVANIAYHSRYIKPAAPYLLKYLKDVIPNAVKRSPKWISTSNLEKDWNTELAEHSSAEYHTNNLLSSVYFEEGLKHIPKDAILIEIAPHGLLQAILKRSLKSCINIPLTQRGCKSGVEFLLTAYGKMYLNGMDIEVSNIYPKKDYPVGRGTHSLAPICHWSHIETWRTGFEDTLYSSSTRSDIEVTLNSEEFRECVGHQMNNNIILPSSFYLNTVYQIMSNVIGGQKQILFENLHFKKPITIPKIGLVSLHVLIEKGSGDFEITSNGEIIVTGKISFPQPTDKYMVEPVELEVLENSVELSSQDFYSELQHRGYKYDGAFRNIKSLTLTEDGSSAVVQWDNRWIILLDSMMQQQFFKVGERYQEVHIPKFIQKICIDLNLVPSKPTDLAVNYEYSTKVISAVGLQIIGMKTALFEKESGNGYIDSLEYVPLNKNISLNIEAGIYVALQLLLANFSQEYLTDVVITEIEAEESLLKYINNALTQYPQLSSSVTSLKDISQIANKQENPTLIVFNDYINDKLVELLVESNFFLLIKSNKEIISYPKVVSIFDFSYNGENYAVVRKSNDSEVIVVAVKDNTLTFKDFKTASAPWVSELYSAIQSALISNKRVFLISSVVPVEGFSNFVRMLRSQPKMDCLRVLFNLDTNLKLDQNKIFRKDLTLTVIKNGIFTSYLPISVKFKENANLPTNTSNLIKDSDTTVAYLALNRSDETLNVINEREELGILDYSGVNSENKNIMGLAAFDKDNSKLIMDPILKWEIPSYYSLEDGATIPYAYAVASYILHVKGQLKHGDTVLIHAGCSPIGMATISVALGYGCKIFTTISTDYQYEVIRKHFPNLTDYQILNSENSSFEPFIMNYTGGNGANLIVNCLSGNLLSSSLNCVASFGKFIQLGQYDLEDNSIGMYCFLRNVSFFTVDVTSLLQQSDDVKQEIRKTIIDGLENYLIRPLWRTLYESQDFEKILRDLGKSSNIGKALIEINNLSVNKLNMKYPHRFICDPKKSYLVYGDSADSWIDMTEWLVLRGAKRIVISTNTKVQQNYINRRLSLLEYNFNCELIFAPAKAGTREGAAELLSEVYYLGPIHSVFVLPVNKNSDVGYFNAVQHLDNALRTIAPKAIFVNFVIAAAGTTQRRADAGFATYNVQCLEDLEFSYSLENLDDVIYYNVKNAFINNAQLDDSKQESQQALYKKLALLLPNSPDILHQQFEDAPKVPEIVQITTEGPMEIRELAPLFIIPGLNTEAEIEKFARQLFVPAFCAVLPSDPYNVKDLAEIFTEQIYKIWPRTFFNIVGVSWGGVLVTEIARILDRRYKANIYVYYIDGAPFTLQSTIKLLGSGVDFEVNLLSRIFNNDDPQVVSKLQSAPDWVSRVNYLINIYKNDAIDNNILKESISLLRNRLMDVITYGPDEHLVTGTIHLIRSTDCSQFDNCELTSYCKQTPQVLLVPGDHLTIISRRETADYINETFQLR
ncbi:fatty acid synthase-like [Sitophilus oryzae]|uniref:Fatty acid synthase-like n=1 Tax=Sitophilus oryzae TaxID=7048 RepID=A0A6J2YDS8_SITOR|nr:fatty acid synthase-like [Sitophilus oryzae]XP_030762054.1 fatty acid synthase-like [Sitophilus oryzae]